jgi:hypothetical protein
MIYWATVIMTRHLARYENGQGPIKRRAANGPAPLGRRLYQLASVVLGS